jgi:hypothetical protein
MRDYVFTEHWFNTRPRAANTEPEPGLRSAPPLPGALSGGKVRERIDPPSRPDRIRSPGPVTSAPLRVGSWLYFIPLGLVALATIGVFFGSGFSLLARHGKETIAYAGAGDHGPPPSYDNAAQPKGDDPPSLRGSTPADPGAVAIPLGSLPGQSAAISEAPPTQQREDIEGAHQKPSGSQPLGGTASGPEPASGSSGPSASATPAASPMPSSITGAGSPGAAKHRAIRGKASHHTRSAQHRSARSDHTIGSLTPPQPAPAGPFDRLLTELTGRKSQ